MEGVNHLAQLGLGAEARVVLQPVNGHITHALAHTISVNAARVGYPHHVKVLTQLLSLLGERCPACSIIAVPIEALQHHTAKHCGPAPTGNRTATAIARDHAIAAAHVNRNRISASRNAESHINILAEGIHQDILAQGSRGHPVVTLTDGSQAIATNASPVITVAAQLGREREVAHVGIILGILAIECHLSSKDVAVGSAHLDTHAGIPSVAVGFTQDVQVTGHGIDGLNALTFNLEALVDRVKRELIFRAIARKVISTMVASLLRGRPRAIDRHLLVAACGTITIGAVKRVPVISRSCKTVGKHKIHLASDGSRIIVRPISLGIHSDTAGWVPPAKRSIAHNIHLGTGLQSHHRSHKHEQKGKSLSHHESKLWFYKFWLSSKAFLALL